VAHPVLAVCSAESSHHCGGGSGTATLLRPWFSEPANKELGSVLDDVPCMANRWKIPPWLEKEILKRDTSCVYCGVAFSGSSASRRSRPSWEHIVNDARIITRENIALCCVGCNASKGAKDLEDWLSSQYCLEHGISENTVAAVVREAILRRPSLERGDA
jgi:hypothetical protein